MRGNYNFSELQGGYFALGLVIGLFAATIFFVWTGDLGDLDVGAYIENFIFLLLGAAGSGIFSVISLGSAKRKANAEMRRYVAEQSFNLYDQLFSEIKTLREVSTRNTAALRLIQIEKFCPEKCNEIVGSVLYTEDEWEKIRKVKNFYKRLGQIILVEGDNSLELKNFVQRGATEYFYDLWALTVHRFYFVKAENLSETDFLHEISYFQSLAVHIEKKP